jgi:hypothetical protein
MNVLLLAKLKIRGFSVRVHNSVQASNNFGVFSQGSPVLLITSGNTASLGED